MKTKTIIKSIEHEDLVELLSTALYGSNTFGAYYNKEDYAKLDNKSDNDCYEDIMAKVLLSGGSIIISDMYAEGKDEFYGKLTHKWDADNCCMDYTITLDDIKNGLQNCLDGTFKKNEGYGSEAEYINLCLHHLMYDSGDLDLPQAENLLQVIIFGQMIYG